MARERSEPRQHFWRILFERSERSERSELCAGPWTRAPQGSRSAAQAASSARRAAPGQPFAATALRLPIDASCVRNWPGPGFPPPRGHRKQILAGRAIAPKVIFLAPRRLHTGGRLRTSDRPETGSTNDRFESPAIRRRPLAGAHPPKRSLKGLAVVTSGDDSCRRNGTHRWTRQDQLGLLDPLRPALAHPCCVALTAGLQRPFAVGQGCIVPARPGVAQQVQRLHRLSFRSRVEEP